MFEHLLWMFFKCFVVLFCFFHLPPGGANDLLTSTTLLCIIITSYILKQKWISLFFNSISFPLLLSLHPFSLLAMRAFKVLPKCDFQPAFESPFLGSQLCVAVATGRNIWWSLHIGELHVHRDGITTADSCRCFVISLWTAWPSCTASLDESWGKPRTHRIPAIYFLKEWAVRTGHNPGIKSRRKEKNPVLVTPCRGDSIKDGWGFCPTARIFQPKCKYSPRENWHRKRTEI